jgi:hypothetical protein
VPNWRELDCLSAGGVPMTRSTDAAHPALYSPPGRVNSGEPATNVSSLTQSRIERHQPGLLDCGPFVGRYSRREGLRRPGPPTTKSTTRRNIQVGKMKNAPARHSQVAKPGSALKRRRLKRSGGQEAGRYQTNRSATMRKMPSHATTQQIGRTPGGANAYAGT